MTLTHGALRADIRTKNLALRIRPGEIAFIRHPDLDATAARALVDCKVAGVVNAASSITGRYPNRGPSVLIEAGIPLLDNVGDELFEKALSSEGQMAVLEEDCLRLKDGSCAHGELLTQATVDEKLEASRANLGVELEAFARNTLEYMQAEQSLLLDPVDLPSLRTQLRGKHAMVVVRGEGYKDDLRAIAGYLEQVRPVIIAVDGGADALLEIGWKPDIIIGDMDSVTDRALRCGAELIVHGYASGNRAAPGSKRLNDLGLESAVFHAPGTSEDMAILLADEKGASIIVAVGTHFSMEEFLDKNRRGMASTFLVRLRTGAKLVDAKGIGRVWAARQRRWPATRELLPMIAAAIFVLMVLAVYSPWVNTIFNTVRLAFRSR